MFKFTFTLQVSAGLFILQILHIGGWAYTPKFFDDHCTANSKHAREDKQFSWADLSPSKKLIWHDCYTAHQCARLIVPLDYSNPDGEIATIAITRVPSSLPPDSPSYRGPILFNPGGPGGSGVDLIVGSGQTFSLILGPEYDIVGFDPRGVGRSQPHVSFFKTTLERRLWAAGAPGMLNTTDGTMTRTWARSKILNQLAQERQLDILKHINTDQTARDMLRIIEAHGREKILYWGFSYGSVLGATFAAMFPDKVERLVIDGVVDAEEYCANLWSNDLLDTDKAMQAFFDGCVAAGPEGCPFYAATPEDVSRNLTTLYDAVRVKPVPYRTESSYGLVDYSFLRSIVFLALYSPYAMFLPLARGLADLAAGNGTALFQVHAITPFECSCDDPFGAFGEAGEAQNALICNDGDDISSSLEDYEKYFKKLSDASSWADIWSRVRAECIGWPKIPKPQFRGPFIGNTSFPILLVGNTADPATPLANAKKMSKGYRGSVVLTQDSSGHGSISAPSICTIGYIRGYFTNGTLPNEGTICPVIGTPFDTPLPQPMEGGQSVFEMNLVSNDRDLLAAVQKLSSTARLPHPLYM